MGYSFAVPETIVRKVVMDLKEYGVAQRAMLGVSYRAIDEDFVEQFGDELGIRKSGGLYVNEVVEGSAAAEAGLRKGDIITAIDGAKTDDASVLVEKIAQRRPGDKVTISYKRNDNDKKVALFAHQGCSTVFLSCLLDIPYPIFSTRFDMCHSGFTAIDFHPDKNGVVVPRIMTLSNDSHLYREGLPLRYNHNDRCRF